MNQRASEDTHSCYFSGHHGRARAYRKYVLCTVLILRCDMAGSTLAFVVMSGEFVQVLQDIIGSQPVTNIGCPQSYVEVYDSTYTQLPTQPKEQISTLLCLEPPTIDVVYACAQTE